jgi:hypothetical protein
MIPFLPQIQPQKIHKVFSSKQKLSGVKQGRSVLAAAAFVFQAGIAGAGGVAGEFRGLRRGGSGSNCNGGFGWRRWSCGHPMVGGSIVSCFTDRHDIIQAIEFALTQIAAGAFGDVHLPIDTELEKTYNLFQSTEVI